MAFVSPLALKPLSKSSVTASCGLRRTAFVPKVPTRQILQKLVGTIHISPRMDRSERTFIAVKPDGMNRGILGDIISRFESKGYKLVGIKTLVPTRQLAEEHYAALRSKPFFNDLVTFITSGPVCAMVWEGEQVVVTARKMIGETNPLSSAPGTIRGDFAVDVGRNVIHGSDAVETAEREIGLWFEQNELTSWQPTSSVWIYE